MMSGRDGHRRRGGLNYRLADTLSGNTADAHRAVLWALGPRSGSGTAGGTIHGLPSRRDPVFKAADLAPFARRSVSIRTR